MTALPPLTAEFAVPSEIIRMTIVQGEAKASADARVEMSTILGSCVATCLFDPVARVGGMNHFLLAEPPAHVRSQAFDSDYGLFLMELLINEMLGLGARKTRMRARLYGGANLNPDLSPIGTANAAFARQFLEREGIPCVFADLEGTQARRIQFRPVSGQVRARLVPAETAPTQKPLGRPQSALGTVELF
ncbi:MAG: chemotaxis protein CheD [Sphingomonadales bacterium]|nr:chemotaxis protein CheD [Sphingomonadales bacterium]NCQ20447.1 chemotaxis protein CheD [Sphingomonadales bacterium]NCT03055.1 chemotaxis protein CheD [Sphingomonadales bacterium]